MLLSSSSATSTATTTTTTATTTTTTVDINAITIVSNDEPNESLDSEDGCFHDSKYFDSNSKYAYPNTRLRRMEKLKRRLVCVGREEDLGTEIPLIHSSINRSVLDFHDKITFYEALNEEIAYLASCYDASKAISLKAFYIDEAHITCEWLVDMMENDLLLSFRISEVNLDELKVQRESINAIRNELYGLLLHPAFSSKNITPVRILRLSDDFNEWTPWQDVNFNSLMRDYSYQCDNGIDFYEIEDRRISDSKGVAIKYCTYETSIIFIYNKEREQHRKPIRAVELKSVVKKYKKELKNDPTFVAFFEEKQQQQQQQQKQQHRQQRTKPTIIETTTISREMQTTDRRQTKDKKSKISLGFRSLLGKNKNDRTSIDSKKKERPALRRRSTSDLTKPRNLTVSDSSTGNSSTGTSVAVSSSSSSYSFAKSEPFLSVPREKREIAKKNDKEKKRKKVKSTNTLDHFLELAGCDQEKTATLLSESILLDPSDTAAENETNVDEPTKKDVESVEIETVRKEKREEEKKENQKSTMRRLRSLSNPITRNVSRLMPIQENKPKEDEIGKEPKTKGKTENKSTMVATTAANVLTKKKSLTNATRVSAFALLQPKKKNVPLLDAKGFNETNP